MTEKITNRVGRIISGSINAVVNAVEDSAPTVVMEQAIREIDKAIDEVRSELGKVIASKHLANKRLAEKNTRHELLLEKIGIALANERDDLAELAVSNQLDIEAQIPVLEHTITECGESEIELEGYVTALQAKKREMQDELKMYRDSIKTTPVDSGGSSNIGQGGVNKSVHHATTAFDRILEKKTGLGSMEAPQDAAKMAELEQLTRENRIKERLTAIKSIKQH